MKPLKPKIGIVSGIGPLAGADVLHKVFQQAAQKFGAIEDAEYPDVLLVNHGVEGVDATAALVPAFQTEILAAVQYLEKQGATIIGIACNTAHLYIETLQAAVGVKLLNLVDTVSEHALNTDKKYLLLTSKSSKEQQLYQNYLKKWGVTFAETSNQQQHLLDKAIEAVMAYKPSVAGTCLDKVLASAKADGFDAVIAGCTELPIAIGWAKNKHNVTVLDSNYVLAAALCTNYYKQLGAMQ